MLRYDKKPTFDFVESAEGKTVEEFGHSRLVDPECVRLCKAMNQLPGVETYESCCGHSKETYCIWFRVRSLRNLPRLVYWFSPCHCGYHGWKVVCTTDCGKSPIRFYVEGPTSAYKEANYIAECLEKDAQVESTIP